MIFYYYDALLKNGETAWEMINSLGALDCLQFEDMNPDIQFSSRQFSKTVKRCQELLLKIDSILLIMKQFNIINQECDEDYQTILDDCYFSQKQNKISGHVLLENIESDLYQKNQMIQQQIANYNQIQIDLQVLCEKKLVQKNFMDMISQFKMLNNVNSDNYDFYQNKIKLNFISGTIDAEDADRFERIIFRATKGNIWNQIKDVQIQEKLQSEKQIKVFLIVFNGGTYEILKQKIINICLSFNARLYEIDQETDNEQQIKSLQKMIDDQFNLSQMTKVNLLEILTQLSQSKNQAKSCSILEEYRIQIERERIIYQTLNKFSQTNSILQCNCWCPKEQENFIIQIIQNVSKQNPDLAGGQFQQIESDPNTTPPTYFQLNAFTRVFQQIVDTYGVPRYKEANPALFTVVTFPFLFGVMFGDILHGFLLFLFGIYLCLNNKNISSNQKDNQHMLKSLSQYRYLLIMSGFFAFYCGLIYNDFASIQFNLFGSCYDPTKRDQFDQVIKKPNCTYPFGIDPIWNLSLNDLQYLNSFKMKMSIIFGVIHMSLGICLKAVNSSFLKLPLDFFFEFIPQIVFLLSLFGYMSFLMIYKWTIPIQIINGNQVYPPAIIDIMIEMFLNGGQITKDSLFDKQLQESVQQVLLTILIICIPLMLIPKPLILIYQNKKQVQTKEKDEENLPLLDEVRQQSVINADKGECFKSALTDRTFMAQNEENENESEIVVHQVIETIEFILGSISNTASYLRLWALSLAHGQLAKVFFDKLIYETLETDMMIAYKVIHLMFGYFIFAAITFCVLLCMDLAECMLHALRLHWVEFQNKFFKGDGKQFIPLSFVSEIQNK